VSDNYPVLVAPSHLPSIREWADRLRCFLAEDSNEFNEAWLVEQQRKLNAVHSYVRDKKLRAELSQCQRWIEFRIGEWLGPAKEGFKGNQYSGSLPGKETEINDRHKHEFRFLAENKDVFVAILEKYEGEAAITRAALIAEIRDSNLREHSPLHWSEEELARRERVEAGVSVVANLRGARDKHLLDWAESKDLLVRVGRGTPWGNPFEIPDDGDRDTVCDRYILHLLHKPSLANKIHSLKGKVLACWCYPERCHGDYLAEWVNKTDPEQKPLHDLAGIDPSLFKLTTRAIGLAADNFSKLVEAVQPQDGWQGLKDSERSAFFAKLRVIGDWIDSLEQQIKEKDRPGGEDRPG
jgi:hypothetical protein